MKAAITNNQPAFALMKKTDIQAVYYMQMPRWLFFDPRYCELSLDAKVTYTFLLNRFQLSRRNGWVNERGEVFVIFPRKSLAAELRVGEKRVTAAFRELTELNLIWEKRCGRGEANQIYLAKVEPVDDPDYSCAPFEDGEECDCCVENGEEDIPRTAEATVQEPSNPPHKSRQNGGSRTVKMAVLEPSDRRSRKKDIRNKEKSKKERVSPSMRQRGSGDVPGTDMDGQTDDDEELTGILEACELSLFPEETKAVFENAIERLFYADKLRIGNSVLPQSRIRSRLHNLNSITLQDVEEKLRSNRDKPVKNSTAFVMTTLFNAITEVHSDPMVDPWLNGWAQRLQGVTG